MYTLICAIVGLVVAVGLGVAIVEGIPLDLVLSIGVGMLVVWLALVVGIVLDEERDFRRTKKELGR